MPYIINFRKRALKEYIGATKWYQKRSLNAAENFTSLVQRTLDEIKNNPSRFRLIYKNFRQAKIKKYPFKIIYFIDEKKSEVIITTLFHNKRNPINKFR